MMKLLKSQKIWSHRHQKQWTLLWARPCHHTQQLRRLTRLRRQRRLMQLRRHIRVIGHPTPSFITWPLPSSPTTRRIARLSRPPPSTSATSSSESKEEKKKDPTFPGTPSQCLLASNMFDPTQSVFVISFFRYFILNLVQLLINIISDVSSSVFLCIERLNRASLASSFCTKHYFVRQRIK